MELDEEDILTKVGQKRKLDVKKSINCRRMHNRIN